MDQAADALLDDLASWVAHVVPEIADRIPAGPAAQLGRLGVPDDAKSADVHTGFAPLEVGLNRVDDAPDSSVLSELGALNPLLTERVLGALELTVERLNLADAPDLTAPWNLPGGGILIGRQIGHQSQALTAATTLSQLSPGAVDYVASLILSVAAHPLTVETLTVPASLSEESEIVAAHGRAYLALAVATTTAALGPLNVLPLIDRSAAMLGIGLSTAVGLLRKAPMPAGYEDALLAKRRAEYVLPRGAAGAVPVSDYRFALLENGDIPAGVDFSGNGLVAVVDGGAVIRTGSAEGPMRVRLSVLKEPPAELDSGWDEVVEVSWRATVGAASMIGPTAPGSQPLLHQTPPWPGDYRLRVQARGRDDTDDEGYALMVWAAPAAPEIVHRRSDRLGHELRGEPAPARIDRPELAYRWVRQSALGEAATVTVVTGSTVEDVLRAFGADPTRPESLRAIGNDVIERLSSDPWVAVLDTGDAVLAVEFYGYEGSDPTVLTQAATAGRAASMFWNVNALTRLKFAEQGRILVDSEPAVAAALAGLNLDDYRDKVGKGLVAVERFTGYSFTSDDLARIQAADIGFRIVPKLPKLWPLRPPRDPEWTDAVDFLTPEIVASLTRLPAPQLHDLAWWVAARAAQYTNLSTDPDVSASIAEHALTSEAHWRARTSQLGDREHHWLWLTLHRASNPDPVAAIGGALVAAVNAAGPHAAELLDAARQRIAALIPEMG